MPDRKPITKALRRKIERIQNAADKKYTNYIDDAPRKMHIKNVSKWGRGTRYSRACDYIAARLHKVLPTYR